MWDHCTTTLWFIISFPNDLSWVIIDKWLSEAGAIFSKIKPVIWKLFLSVFGAHTQIVINDFLKFNANGYVCWQKAVLHVFRERKCNNIFLFSFGIYIVTFVFCLFVFTVSVAPEAWANIWPKPLYNDSRRSHNLFLLSEGQTVQVPSWVVIFLT